MSKDTQPTDQIIDEELLQAGQEIEAKLEELQAIIGEFPNIELLDDSPSFKSDDVLQEAYRASTIEEKKKLAKKALKIYPDNIDAESLLASIEPNPIKKLKAYEKIVAKATKRLEEEDCFDEDSIGIFWGIIETRPYMRARHGEILALMDLGRYREAMENCEDLLRLCHSDNLGIRYLLIGLYCLLEEFEKGEALFKKYNQETTFMVLPMAILYYKKGDYPKARKQLKLLNEINPYVIETLGSMNSSIAERDDKYYARGTETEAQLIISDLLYLLASVPSFIIFALHEELK